MVLTTARTIFPNNNNINMERFIRNERNKKRKNKIKDFIQAERKKSKAHTKFISHI